MIPSPARSVGTCGDPGGLGLGAGADSRRLGSHRLANSDLSVHFLRHKILVGGTIAMQIFPK